MRSLEKLRERRGNKMRFSVFRRRLKVPSVSDAVTLDGKVFHTRGAATKNAQSPIVVRHEDGVTRADVGEDRSLFLDTAYSTSY